MVNQDRVQVDLYRKRFDEIFKPKTLHEELMEGYEQEQKELEGMKKSNKYNYIDGKQRSRTLILEKGFMR